MERLTFVKMVASGNDFVVIDSRDKEQGARHKGWGEIARLLCERKTGVGADGLLVLEPSKKADFKMRIFNADGSEAEMCGNGLRCVTLYKDEHQSTRAPRHKKKVKIETKAGVYEAKVTAKDRVEIKMEDPKDGKLNFPIEVSGRKIKVNYIDTGVPHAVIFVQGIEEIDVEAIGRNVRYHKKFKPRGTNVDFVEIVDDENIKMRTYERGVEGETLACGTGAVAAAIITKDEGPLDLVRLRSPQVARGRRRTKDETNVHTRGGILKVSFTKRNNRIKDVYLEGEAKEVYTGQM